MLWGNTILFLGKLIVIWDGEKGVRGVSKVSSFSDIREKILQILETKT